MGNLNNNIFSSNFTNDVVFNQYQNSENYPLSPQKNSLISSLMTDVGGCTISQGVHSVSQTYTALNNHAIILQSSSNSILPGTIGVVPPITSINTTDPEGHTDLMRAVLEENLADIKKLIEAGTDITVKNKFGNTALMLAVQKNDEHIVKILLEAHVKLSVSDEANNFNITPLIQASMFKKWNIVKLLVDFGANTKSSNHGLTALTFAVHYQQTDMVEMLVRTGIDKNAYSKFYKTALINAVLLGNKEIVKILIEAHAQLDVHNDVGETPLMRAILINENEIVELLKRAGANQDYAKEAINRKILAHLWGISGHSSLINQTTREEIEFRLEAIPFCYGARLMSKYAEEFFQSNPEISDKLSKKSQDEILMAFNNPFERGPRNRFDEIAKKIESGLPDHYIGRNYKTCNFYGYRKKYPHCLQ